MKVKILCFNKKFYKRLKIISGFIFFLLIITDYRKKKIGVISIEHSQNIGNNLLKYAIFIKLTNLGYDPYIVGMKLQNHNISFIQNNTKLRLINKSFSEIKENDYDILMVNSDQTWRKWSNEYKYLYDLAFLKFAEKWDKPKFVYGASLGLNIWQYNKSDEEIAKSLLKDFNSNGISVREKGAIKLIKKHLNLSPIFVLDPTFLIDKQYYFNLIKNYKGSISTNDNFIFIYTISNLIDINSYIKKIKEIYKYKIYWVKNNIKDFIYGMYYCKSVITDSYHRTLFSIIFNKPFIAFLIELNGKERFNSLKEIFDIENRLFDINSKPDIALLEKGLNLNMTIFDSLKKESIKFLKNNLRFHKKY